MHKLKLGVFLEQKSVQLVGNVCTRDLCTYLLSHSLSSDSTLTTVHVMQVLKRVSSMDYTKVLDAPLGMFHFHSHEAIVSHALKNHPCLTWRRLSNNLQKYGYSEVAAEVAKKYVRGW